MTTEQLGLTPSQTVGPYLSIGLLRGLIGNEVVARATTGRLVIRGRLIDGVGEAVPDGMIETWQVDDTFRGLGRSGTADGGWFEIVTVKPAATRLDDGRTQAPHLAVSVFARGLLKRLATRLYFPDEAAANASDPILGMLAPSERQALVARRENGYLRFDVRLQGPGQTPFFAW